MSSGFKPSTTPVIALEPAEDQLTSLLREASQNSAFSDPEVTIRYAGGWVRDKILRKPSHDIDIAISSLSGHEFAVQFSAYLTIHHPDLRTGTITKILANPEKSKHLDTATSRFLNLDLDFVQLRTESYGAVDSRTPDVVGVGTLEQDAERRDCTMNALYYNIHTMAIEDPTRLGLDDLANGLIQTPLAPKKTFLDDPLRVLRSIRFASQFGFTIAPETFAEMKTMPVREALKRKVVKERVGIEVFKMMKGIDPARAIRVLESQALYHVVFQDAEPTESFPWFDFDIVSRAIDMIQGSAALRAHLGEYLDDGRLWLLISLLPYRERMVPVPKKKPAVEEPLACVIIRDCLKGTTVHEALMRATFPPRAIDVPCECEDSLLLGRLVRGLKKDWMLALLVAALHERTPVEDLVSRIDTIKAAGMDRAWSFTPFIDGKRIRPLCVEAGVHVKVMKELTELVVEFRMADPKVTESEALARLREYLRTRPLGPEGW